MTTKECLRNAQSLKLAIHLLNKGIDKHLTARATGLDIRKVDRLERQIQTIRSKGDMHPT